MEPDALTFDKTGERRRRAHYMSRSGWGVFPDEVHAGDVVHPSTASLLPSVDLLVEPHEGDEHCRFCSDPGDHDAAIAERGQLVADYTLVLADGGDVVEYTCHACIEECDVVERARTDYDVGDVYERRDD